MRQVVLDTETTGLEPSRGHRIIEIGCIELKQRRKTNRHFHHYLNPERDIEDGAYDIHGISNEFLNDKPRFCDIAQDLIDFIKGSELIIHNAPFDVAFLNTELQLLGEKWGKIDDHCTVIDTLAMAREKHPGQKNNLDALCQRYKVDNSQRDLHGALLDAQILVDIYLAMTGGQTDLSLDDPVSKVSVDTSQERQFDPNRPRLRIIQPTSKELEKHRLRLKAIDEASKGKCVWKRLEEMIE